MFSTLCKPKVYNIHKAVLNIFFLFFHLRTTKKILLTKSHADDNTCKSSLGIVSKKMLDDILPLVRSKTCLLQLKTHTTWVDSLQKR